MNIFVKVNGSQIRPLKLHSALSAQFVLGPNSTCNDHDVSIDCAPADEAGIRALIATHLATDWNAQDATAKTVADEAEAAIKQDAVIASIKSMTQDEYNTWWAANVTTAAQAIGVLKRVVRVLCRRVL